MKKEIVLIIDHIDSFVNNIKQMFIDINKKTILIKHNKTRLIILNIILKKPKTICLGPGPGNPYEYIETYKILKMFYKEIRILGICLGHQIIATFFGYKIKKSKDICHGETREIKINNMKISQKIDVIRYNSLTVIKTNEKMKIKSTQKETKEIMIIEHKKHKIISIQFHPESILTKRKKLIKSIILL